MHHLTVLIMFIILKLFPISTIINLKIGSLFTCFSWSGCFFLLFITITSINYIHGVIPIIISVLVTNILILFSECNCFILFRNLEYVSIVEFCYACDYVIP